MTAANDTNRELPLITVGLTCFNADDTIGRAIESALHQEWPNLEIVVVDDGSSDESASVIRRYAEGDRRIRSLRHESNKGYPAALNTVLDAATGEFIAVFDDDDVSVPERISKQWRRLTEYERSSGADRVLCYSNRSVVKSGVEGSSDYVYAIGRSPVEPRGAAVADFVLWHREDPVYTWGQFGSCTLFVRTETLAAVGGFDERFLRSAEWDLAIRAALTGAHFISVDEALITQHLTPTEDKSGRAPIEYALRLRQKHKAYLKSPGLYLASRVIARARYYYAKQKPWASGVHLALACLLSPSKVLPSELGKWRRRKSGATDR